MSARGASSIGINLDANALMAIGAAMYVNEVPSKLVGPYDFCVEAVASAAGIDLLTDIYMVEVDKKP